MRGAWTVCTTPQGWGTLLGAAELPAQPDRVGAARVGFRQEEPPALGLQEYVGLEQELVWLPILPLAATFSIPGKPSWMPEPSPSSPEAHTLFPPFVPQLVSEKVGGAEGTKLDDDFKEMEKVTREGCLSNAGSVTSPHRPRPLHLGGGEAYRKGLGGSQASPQPRAGSGGGTAQPTARRQGGEAAPRSSGQFLRGL